MRQRPTAPARLLIATAAATLALSASGAARAATAADFPASAADAWSAVAKSVNSGWQCAQFARLFSGINIVGDAWTWWDKATGRYAKGFKPQEGSVLVFRPSGAMRLGHVAVVSQVLTDRIIQVTHANWSLIGGRRGQVEKDVTVVDVSDAGDWSRVKVWFDPTGALGTTTYPTYGFIYKALDSLKSVASVVGGGASAR